MLPLTELRNVSIGFEIPCVSPCFFSSLFFLVKHNMNMWEPAFQLLRVPQETVCFQENSALYVLIYFYLFFFCWGGWRKLVNTFDKMEKRGKPHACCLGCRIERVFLETRRTKKHENEN